MDNTQEKNPTIREIKDSIGPQTKNLNHKEAEEQRQAIMQEHALLGGTADVAATLETYLDSPRGRLHLTKEFYPEDFGRALPEVMKLLATAGDAKAPSRGNVRTLADVEPGAIKYLWEPYLPSGMLCGLSGDTGSGKTWVLSKLTAEITKGGSLPNGTNAASALLLQQSVGPGSVLVLQKELSESAIIRPRVEALGGDLSRVHIPPSEELAGILLGPEDRHISSYLQIAYYLQLEKEATGRAHTFMYIDPIGTFMDADMRKGLDVRTALERLAALAGHYGTTILFVNHWNKNFKASTKHRSSGSIEFEAVPRSTLQTMEDPESEEEDRFLLFHQKRPATRGTNLAFQLTGKVDQGNFSFAWAQADASQSAQDIAASEVRKAEGRGNAKTMKKADHITLSILENLSALPPECEGFIPSEQLKALVDTELEAMGGVTSATWARATKALKDKTGLGPVEASKGLWGWYGLKSEKQS